MGLNHDNVTPAHHHAAGAAKRPSQARLVADIMTTELTTLSPHHSFGEAVRLMANGHFHHLLVVDDAVRLVGVISDRDILRALSRIPDWQTKEVSSVMSRDPLSVRPEDFLAVAVADMLERRINCLPVVGQDGKVCGIITSTDLLKRYQQILASNEQTPL